MRATLCPPVLAASIDGELGRSVPLPRSGSLSRSSDGSIQFGADPPYLEATDRDGVRVGFIDNRIVQVPGRGVCGVARPPTICAADVAATTADNPQPVYATDFTTVVGHIYLYPFGWTKVGTVAVPAIPVVPRSP